MPSIATATTDPSNNTAHDPTNHPGAAIVHPAAHSTRMSLALARADIHTEINDDDDHRRRQFAVAARDYAG